MMLYTEKGEFELLKEYKNAFVMDDFNKRYQEILDLYPYIVGDYSDGILRLKGFKEKSEEGKKNGVKNIPDYIVESCIYDAPYYILKNSHYNPNKKISED